MQIKKLRPKFGGKSDLANLASGIMSLMQYSNHELIKLLKNADERAFRLLYDQFSPKIYAYAFRFLKSREQSEEVIQETMLSLWINRLQLNDEHPLGAFIYTIAKRITLNMLRKMANSELATEALWKNMQGSSNITEDAVLLADLQRFSEEVLATLPKQQQLIFRLSRHEGLSHEEIADQLQISKNTVKNHLVEALKRIRSQFQQSDILYFFLLYFLF